MLVPISLFFNFRDPVKTEKKDIKCGSETKLYFYTMFAHFLSAGRVLRSLRVK